MRTIAIGLLALVLAVAEASAQTADERARILRDFEERVADYTTRHKCFDMFPEALNPATPAPRIFTPPVAVVFRQEIARALAERDGVAALNGVGVFAHPVVLEPFPSHQLHEFPRVLQDALPPLPATLEYRLIGHDLVVRDKEADIIVGVLRDAVGNSLTVVR
ncbi:MAG TPA: hypothetical protein VJ691_10885 [Vicinamibacterales bacterium]|nr:hypothetical protein [Vicinamibacterales bacterium]